ncbi:MAG: hypothetical protein ACRDP6_29230 [Actinoallomurus sp.]
MNTLNVRAVVSVAAAGAIAAGFTAGVSTLATPIIEIPILPADLSGALLVILGFILGRATQTRVQRRTGPAEPRAQVTARMVPQLPSEAQAITPTAVMLPATRDEGDTV